MKHYRFLTQSIAASCMFAAVNATALPISEYNLIVKEDYTHGSAVWGSTFIGGNMTSNGGEFGTRLGSDFSGSALTVVGDISGGSFNVLDGDVVYGGSLSAGVDIPNGSVTQGNQAALEADAAQMFSELEQATIDYSLTASNGFVNYGPNQINLTYSGSDSIAVFDADAQSLFAQDSSLNLFAGSAETVVINVSTGGGDFTGYSSTHFQTGFNKDSDANNVGASNILWNFYDAQNLSLQDMTFSGSILAVGANILSLGTIDGSVAALSFSQNRQVHNDNFNPPSEVPIPASFQLALLGLAGISMLRWRRRKTAA